MTEANITVEDLQPLPNGQAVKLITVAGQLDESNVDEKIKVIYESLQNSATNLSLIFNLDNLNYMNSKSIGYLTDIYGKISENGGKVLLSGAKANILDILEVVGLTQLMQTFTTLPEAINALANTSNGSQ